MSLEEALQENTKTMKELIAALAGKGGTTAAATTAGKGATGAGKASATKAPKIDAKTVTEKAVAVKTALGEDAAKTLIKTAGKADKLKEIAEENYPAFVAACDKALEDGEVAGEDDDGL